MTDATQTPQGHDDRGATRCAQGGTPPGYEQIGVRGGCWAKRA